MEDVRQLKRIWREGLAGLRDKGLVRTPVPSDFNAELFRLSLSFLSELSFLSVSLWVFVSVSAFLGLCTSLPLLDVSVSGSGSLPRGAVPVECFGPKRLRLWPGEQVLRGPQALFRLPHKLPAVCVGQRPP